MTADDDEIEDILRRADDPDLYDGDEAQEWIIDNRILPDLKKLADAYRQLKGTGCVFIPTGEV